MKQNDLLSLTSVFSVLLLALHISQDIVFGFDRAGLNHLVGVAILLVLVCGAVLLRERRLGKVIMYRQRSRFTGIGLDSRSPSRGLRRTTSSSASFDGVAR